MWLGRNVLSLVVCASLVCICIGRASGEPAKDDAWQEIEVAETTGFIVPDAVILSLGIPVQDIPLEQNAATYYLRAIAALPGMDHEIWEDYDEALKGPWGREIGQFYSWFQETAEARGLLRKGASMEHCSFPYIVSTPGDELIVGMLLPQLAQMRNLARLCMIEGHLFERQGEFRNALESYRLAMRLGAHVAEGATLINGLVGIAMHTIGARAMAACLARNSVPANTLEWLAGELANTEQLIPDRTRWVAGERAMGLQIVGMSPSEAITIVHGGGKKASSKLSAVMGSRAFRIVWPDRTIKKDFTSFYDGTDELCQKPTWKIAEAVRATEAAGDRMPVAMKDWNFYAALLLPALSRAHLQCIGSVCEHDALIINVALRRYRAANGRYPDTLAELSPDFLAEVPVDAFSGQSFKYRLEGEEWILHSVGPDGDDDGGRGDGLVRNVMEDGDIVYRSIVQEN